MNSQTAEELPVQITLAHNQGYGFALSSQFGMHGKSIYIAYGKSINGECSQYECQDDSKLHGDSIYCKNCKNHVDYHEIIGYLIH